METASKDEYEYLTGGKGLTASLEGLDEEVIEKNYKWDMAAKIVSLEYYKKEKYITALSSLRNIVKFIPGPTSSPRMYGVYVYARAGYTTRTGRPIGDSYLIRQRLFA